MTNIRRALEAAAAGGDDATYVEDVFSTYVYTGTDATSVINNGTDLDGEGGMVWIKGRTGTAIEHFVYDTERGATKSISTNDSTAEYTSATTLTGFNSNGFTLSTSAYVNSSTRDYASWTFRKTEKFFDIVTYTGNSVTGREISHNLGSVPGCIIIKNVSSARSWIVYHVSNGNANIMKLDSTAAIESSALFNSTTPTSTVFEVNNDNDVNATGDDYVAYLFANNEAEFGADSDESIIACGTYLGPNPSDVAVTLGWEPQWLMIKNTERADNWDMLDTMRGIHAKGIYGDAYLEANTSDAEIAGTSHTELFVTPTGFTVPNGASGRVGEAGEKYIYIAIRRGPMKVPEAGTEVFAVDSLGGGPPGFEGVLTDWAWKRTKNTSDDMYSQNRLTGATEMKLNDDDAEGAGGGAFDYMDGWLDSSSSLSTQLSWMFKRAPEFMDIVCYTGSGSNTTQSHNLGVAPEMIMVKRRNDGEDWVVYSQPTGNEAGTGLNTDAATYTGVPQYWNSTSPTASVFSLGTYGVVNTSAKTYIAYLFATLAGVSKVGSYTADGTLTTINCGFSAGARFILIKRTDAAGDWYFWDYLRGIVAGNDPYLLVNTTAAEVTGTDYIDPDNSGFQITAAGSSTINVDTGEYIFLAIA